MPALPPWLLPTFVALQTNRGHAVLIQGASGLGQRELALALARTWLCERPAGADGACGDCPSCHAIAVHAHADLAVLMPETELLAAGWPMPEKAQADIDEKRRKPSNEIRIDALREVIEFAQRTSARGRGKVVLIDPADRLNDIAANALLKTLEEPPGDTRFILATSEPHRLPATIRSRCQAFRLPWPAPADVIEWLRGQGVAPATAQDCVRLAGGLPMEALRLAQGERDVQGWSRLPRALAQGDATALTGLGLREAIAVLQKVCVDRVAQRLGAEPRFFRPADLPPMRPDVDDPSALRALSAWSRVLFQAAEHADHPYQTALALEAHAAQARKVLGQT